MKVVVGGTFDCFHRGHEALLGRAFEVGDEVHIGVTSDAFASKKGKISQYSERVEAVTRFASRLGKPFTISKLDDVYGETLQEGIDAIVVSTETLKQAKKINALRKRRGLKPLEIFVVKKVLAEDLFPISSTRIREGEINRMGKRLRALTIAIGSTNPVKIEATKQILAKIFPAVEMRLYPGSVDSGVGSQPFGNATIRGAINRAMQAIGDCDYGIGIEAGLFYIPGVKKYYDVQYCVIVDKFGRRTVGHGPGFCYPDEVIECVKHGDTIEDAIEELYGIKKIGQSIGAIGLLSRGHTDRMQITQQAVLMAFVPRLHGWE